MSRAKKQRERKPGGRRSSQGFFFIPGSLERCAFVIVLVAAVSVRLIYLGELRRAPFFDHPVGDSKIYHSRALEIASGDLIGREAYFHSSPFYPYFLALIYRLLGARFLAVRLFQFLIGSLNCFLVYKLAGKIPGAGRGTSLIAGLFAAFCGILVFFDGDLLMITLVLFFVNASILCLARSSLPCSLLSGLLLGFSALGKPNVLLFAPFALFWIFTGFEKRFFRQKWREGILFTLGCIMAVSPITLRNYIVSGDLVLVSSNAGVNFFIGNNEEADGVFFLPPGSGLDNARLYLSSREAAEKATGSSGLKPSQVSRYWTRRALDFMRENSAAELKLLLRKFLLFWNRYEIPNHHNFYFIRTYYAGLLGWLFVGFSWIAPLALVGIVGSYRSLRFSPVVRLYVAFIFIYMTSLIPFFITARYRLPVVPFLIIFAAVGLRELFRTLREARWRKLGLLAAIGFGTAIVVNWPIVEYDFAFNHTVIGTVYSDLATKYPGRAQEYIGKAIVEYKKALELRPYFVDANYNLGITYQRIGYYSGAVERLRSALAANPEHHYAGRALDECLGSLDGTGDKVGKSVLPLTPFELGLKFREKGNALLARAQYERALTEDPQHASAYSELGAIYFDEGDFGRAIEIFEKGLRYQPDHFILHNNLAGAYYRSGDLDKAKEHWKRCLEIDPEHEGVKRQLRLVGD